MYKFCIIGLGNPGTKYNDTRHNIGKDWLLKLSSRFFDTFKTKSKFQADIGESHEGEILWLISKNYMNESGITVSKILKSTNLKLNKFVIIHDDLDLSLGEMKLKIGGGHGGHNGLRDIIKITGQDNFMRIRVGIGHPGNKEDVTNWVLTKFSPNEKKLLLNSYLKLEEVFEMICNGQINEAQKILNTNKIIDTQDDSSWEEIDN